MLATYLGGIGLGLALITPIGPQNLFVLNAGFAVGAPRVLAATIAITLCDAFLITIGTLGAGALLEAWPGARVVLLALGVVFLTYLGIQGFRTEVSMDVPAGVHAGAARLFAGAAAVSMLNPHAVLDTVAVIGLAASAQPQGLAALFALGAITGSLVWFLALGLGAAAIRSRLSLRARVWIQRLSASVILAFAGVLLAQLIHLLAG